MIKLTPARPFLALAALTIDVLNASNQKDINDLHLFIRCVHSYGAVIRRTHGEVWVNNDYRIPVRKIHSKWPKGHGSQGRDELVHGHRYYFTNDYSPGI